MKTKKLFISIGIIVLFLTGCIPSLHPLYNDNDRIEVPEILGNWISDSKDIWEFTKVKDAPSYILKYTEKEQEGEVQTQNNSANINVNIIELDGQLFIDLYPGDNESLDNMNDMLQIHLVAAHTFAKLNIVDGKPQISHMNGDWLSDLFEENKIRIKHEVVGDKIILTASTKQLQKFVLKYADDKDAFLDPEILNPLN